LSTSFYEIKKQNFSLFSFLFSLFSFLELTAGHRNWVQGRFLPCGRLVAGSRYFAEVQGLCTRAPLVNNGDRKRMCNPIPWTAAAWIDAEFPSGHRRFEVSAWTGGGYSLVWDPWCFPGYMNPLTPKQSKILKHPLPVRSSTPSYIMMDSVVHDGNVIDSINNKALVNNLRGIMKQKKGRNYTQVYTVTVWLPNHDTINNIRDSIVTPAKTIWQGVIRFVNGVAYFEGGFSGLSSSLYSIDSSDPTYNTLTFNSINQTIDMPNNVSSDYVEVLFEGDSYTPEDDLWDMLLDESDERKVEDNVTLTVAPNPVPVDLTITAAVPTSGNIVLTLTNWNTGAVHTVFSGTIAGGQPQQYLVQDNTLANGVYLCTLLYNDVPYYRRVIIQ
jgi:hypothetical protein